MREYVVAYGHARITEGGAVPLLRRLAPILPWVRSRLSAGLHAELAGLRSTESRRIDSRESVPWAAKVGVE